MKKKYFFATLLTTMLSLTVSAQIQQPRIAVLDFNAGVKIEQEEIDGISAMFNTFFEPEGYTIVERTRVSRILEEQHIQVGSITEEQRVRLGEILNVKMIVIGDVNYAMRQYNVDVRVVDVETGAIIAKDGAEWSAGNSYRKMMKKIAERISDALKIEPEDEPDTILYRPTGGSLRFTAGMCDVIGSIAYNHFITPYLMVGGGCGIGYGTFEKHDDMCIPVYIETELRTPRYKWSLFVNLKAGARFSNYQTQPFASFAIGASYKNLNLGAGVTTAKNAGILGESQVIIFLSYNLPLSNLF